VWFYSLNLDGVKALQRFAVRLFGLLLNKMHAIGGESVVYICSSSGF
jgi:hypothetical protein